MRTRLLATISRSPSENGLSELRRDQSISGGVSKALAAGTLFAGYRCGPATQALAFIRTARRQCAVDRPADQPVHTLPGVQVRRTPRSAAKLQRLRRLRPL